MNLYLASSWRNKDRVNQIANALESDGHECFNFTNPGPDAALPNGFHWSDLDGRWQDWTPEAYRESLGSPIAQAGLRQDFDAMRAADACVAVMPFGRSASLETGWFVGAGKPAFILLAVGEPELMFALATKLCCSVEELVATLRDVETERQQKP